MFWAISAGPSLEAAAERGLVGMRAALEAGGGSPYSGGVDSQAVGAAGPLDADEAAAVRRELDESAEDWAAAVRTLRRGQEEILEHVASHARNS